MNERWFLDLLNRPDVRRMLRVSSLSIGILVGPFTVASQTPPPPAPVGELLRRSARLDVRLVPLERALTELSRTSGVPISFSPSLLPKGDPVSCRCFDLTVG